VNITARWLFWVAYEWTLIAASYACALRWPLLWPLALIVIGTRQHALAVLGHEAVHFAVYGTARLNRRINDALGNLLCMWPLLADVAGYRRWHLLHHQFVGTVLDPEIEQRALFADRWVDLTPRRKLALLIKDMVGLHWREAFAVLRTTAGAWTLTRSAYVLALAGLVVVGLGWSALLAWVVAMATGALAAMRARMYREHLGPAVTQVYTATLWERALYLPHYVWMHERHHRRGCWAVPCWDLKHLRP
jgi:fatty acid desaturase